MPFPSAIDSTMRATFTLCPKKFEYEFIHNKVPAGATNINLHFGAVFAAALETFRRSYYGYNNDKTYSLILAIRRIYTEWGPYDEGVAERKSLPSCIEALVAYFDNWHPGTDHIQPMMRSDGIPAVELSFSFPLDVKHPDTGQPILYAGRHDMLGLYGGQLYVVDEKTPRQLGANWAAQWPLRSQFTGYCASAKMYGLPVVGAIVRGVGILPSRITFAEHITLRPDWMIERWHMQLERDVQRMVDCYTSGYFDLNLDEGCSAFFRPCEYAPLCLSRYPDRILASQYTDYHWSPIKHAPECEEEIK